MIGAGEPRQVQRISEVDKQVLPPGTSGQEILNRPPGVSVPSNDAFGADEESQTISMAASTSAGWATCWTASRGATTATASTTA